MDLLHVHLVLNHVPLIGLALAVAIVGWGVARRSDEVIRVGYFLVVLAAITAGAAFLTGEPAEDRVGGLAGVSRATIEQHEESAQAALVGVLAVAVVVLLSMFLRWNRNGAVAVIVMGAVAFALVAWTANLGGKIRHTELAGAAAPATTGEADHGDD